MPESGQCPDCGAPLSDSALSGQCPECLLRLGLGNLDWAPVNWPIANEMVFRENQRNHP